MYISGSNIGGNSRTPFQNVNKKNGGDSEKGTSNNMIDQLRKQREDVVKQKNALIAKTGEANQPLSSIKEQLKAYDQRIDNIDTQIATETAAMTEKALEKQKDGKDEENINSSKPKTEEEINNDKMAMVAKLGHSMEAIKNIDSVRKQSEGEVGITEQEIKLDQGRRDNFIDTVEKMNPGTGELLQKKGLSITNKEEKLSGLRERIIELSRTLGKEVGEIQQEIEDSRLQDKLQGLLDKWNKAESGKTEGSEQVEGEEQEGVKLPAFMEEAFKTASKATTDFLGGYKAWSKEALEKGLSGDKKTDFMFDKLDAWEENLKKNSPDEYQAWKQITASVDVFA